MGIERKTVSGERSQFEKMTLKTGYEGVWVGNSGEQELDIIMICQLFFIFYHY